MKRNSKWIAGIAASLALGLAAASVHAHQGGGMRHGMQGMHDGKQGEMGCGSHEGQRHGARSERGAGAQMMTPEERNAHREKMRNAATAEERQKLRDEMRADMDKRAKDRGITLNEQRGPRSEGGHKH